MPTVMIKKKHTWWLVCKPLKVVSLKPNQPAPLLLSRVQLIIGTTSLSKEAALTPSVFLGCSLTDSRVKLITLSASLVNLLQCPKQAPGPAKVGVGLKEIDLMRNRKQTMRRLLSPMMVSKTLIMMITQFHVDPEGAVMSFLTVYTIDLLTPSVLCAGYPRLSASDVLATRPKGR